MWSLSSVADYKITKNPESRRRALKAASHLAGRFNLKGSFIRAWNEKQNPNSVGWSIIDTSLNLPLLFWASEETKDPRFKHIAMAHADMILKYFQREDGSTHHIMTFDPETGVCLGPLAGQGYSKDSAWARGQSWIIYGMALCYRYTKEERYLNAAMKATDFFLSNLPENMIPYWDFKAPISDNTPTDSSAAACALCGILEIADSLTDEKANVYHEKAILLAKALYKECFNHDSNKDGILGGATFNYPKNKGINVSLIYGDYYFTEAIMRLNGIKEIFW